MENTVQNQNGPKTVRIRRGVRPHGGRTFPVDCWAEHASGRRVVVVNLGGGKLKAYDVSKVDIFTAELS